MGVFEREIMLRSVIYSVGVSSLVFFQLLIFISVIRIKCWHVSIHGRFMKNIVALDSSCAKKLFKKKKKKKKAGKIQPVVNVAKLNFFPPHQCFLCIE